MFGCHSSSQSSPIKYILHLDPNSGSSVDWVFATQNISLAYTFEFRDTGNI